MVLAIVSATASKTDETCDSTAISLALTEGSTFWNAFTRSSKHPHCWSTKYAITIATAIKIRLLSLPCLLEDEEFVLVTDFLTGDFFLGVGDFDRFLDDFTGFTFLLDFEDFFVFFFGVLIGFASTTPFESYVNLAGGPVLRLDDLRSAGIFFSFLGVRFC